MKVKTGIQKLRLLILLMTSCFLMSVYSITARAASLPLECSGIPNHSDRLCFIQTESSYGPYDDIVFYRMDKKGYAYLLGSQQGEVSTFGGFEFSTGGRYMYISWAEEGHPHFVFYNTRKFLDNGLSSNSLEILGDYYFNYFVSFTDTGEVVYALSDDGHQNCNAVGEFVINVRMSEKYCVKQFNLNKKTGE